MKKYSLVFLVILIAISSVLAQKKSAEYSDEQAKSFTVKPGGLLQVDVEPGAVRIEPWAKDEVYVEATGLDERHPDRLVISQSGNDVSVRYRDSRHQTDHLQFVINVPAKYNIDIQTSGGSVKQSDVLTGNFKAETKGGSIKLEHIIGNVDAETGGGSIKVKKIEGDGHLQTGGGSVETDAVTGTLEVSTGGGSITMYEAGGKVNATTGGGSIKLENAKAWVDLSTGGGSVRVRGAAYGAKVKTGGGSIEMEDITGVVNVATGGGSIQCELNPGSEGNSTISTGGGEIQLSLPGNAKAVVDATIDISRSWGRHRKKYSIRSDFKADTYEGSDESGDIHAAYTLNGGGPKISLKTSNSDIEITKRSSR